MSTRTCDLTVRAGDDASSKYCSVALSCLLLGAWLGAKLSMTAFLSESILNCLCLLSMLSKLASDTSAGACCLNWVLNFKPSCQVWRLFITVFALGVRSSCKGGTLKFFNY